MESASSVARHFLGAFDERALIAWAKDLRAELRANEVSLGLLFLTPSLFADAEQILEILRVHAQIPRLLGCSSTGLIAGEAEFEDVSGLALGLYHLPGAELKPFRFTAEQLDEAQGPSYWRLETGVEPVQTRGWLAFLDPFHLDADAWLQAWNETYPAVPLLGGLSSGHFAENRTQLYLDGKVFEAGGVALSIGGDVKLVGAVSQGCTPVGETWTVTKVEQNLIHQIGNRPAYEVLVETFHSMAKEEQEQSRGNLFVGLVVNEYLHQFQRGDFLIRNLLGADPQSGAIAVGAFPRAGQTLQFQRRDASAASEDLSSILHHAKKNLGKQPIYGGCLFCCNGRGAGLFHRSSHDASLVQQTLGPLGLTGFFCNGEIGPVGERNFLHGYTASLGLFVKQ